MLIKLDMSPWLERKADKEKVEEIEADMIRRGLISYNVAAAAKDAESEVLSKLWELKTEMSFSPIS